MSNQPEIWSCPHCGTQQDISQLGFFSEIQCPKCGYTTHVHTMLSNYKVQSVLGIGGMSVVFQAMDLVLSRPLAIKVLNDTYRDAPERIAGFENECSLMAKVRHENVVAVYSAGWARGQFYIGMELVDGRNLELIVAEQGALPPLQAIEIIRQVALGLQAAHAAGILHRDVKPGNVLISADGHAKVLDFGLSLDEKTSVDEEEIIWATPYYVSPETLRREEEKVQSDIYALGMTLRNLLTGEAVLPGSPQTLADMLVSKKTLQPLSLLNPQLDAKLCKLVDCMTAFDAAERPASYAELLEKIAPVQRRLAKAIDPVERARRIRKRLFVATGATVTLTLGVLGAFVVALLTPAASIQETYDVSPLVWMERDTYLEAESLLKSGDVDAADAVLSELTTEDTEPTLAAAATLLRTALDVLEGKATANGYKRFAEIADRKDQLAPAGEAAFNQMEALVAALKGNRNQARELTSSMANPILKVAAEILVADAFVHAGEAELAEQMITQAVATMNASELPAMNALVEEYRAAAPRRASRLMLEQAKLLFQNGNYDAARKQVPVLLQMQKLGNTEKEELRVLCEASLIKQAILQALQKKGGKVSRGTYPSDLRDAAESAGLPAQLATEFYCIALILDGDIDAALRENPYAGDEESQEPFAVIMRDWKARLGK